MAASSQAWAQVAAWGSQAPAASSIPPRGAVIRSKCLLDWEGPRPSPQHFHIPSYKLTWYTRPQKSTLHLSTAAQINCKNSRISWTSFITAVPQKRKDFKAILTQARSCLHRLLEAPGSRFFCWFVNITNRGLYDCTHLWSSPYAIWTVQIKSEVTKRKEAEELQDAACSHKPQNNIDMNCGTQ